MGKTIRNVKDKWGDKRKGSNKQSSFNQPNLKRQREQAKRQRDNRRFAILDAY